MFGFRECWKVTWFDFFLGRFDEKLARIDLNGRFLDGF